MTAEGDPHAWLSKAAALAALEVWATLEAGVARPERNTEANVAEKKTETETAQQEAGQAKGSQKITKMEAVRRALDELGPEAMPKAIQGFVMDRFGIEMNTDHISTYKGDIRRKAGVQGKPRGRQPATQQSAARTAEAKKEAASPALAKATPAPPAKGMHAIPLEDVLTIKDLVVRLGPGPLRTLIDTFAT